MCEHRCPECGTPLVGPSIAIAIVALTLAVFYLFFR